MIEKIRAAFFKNALGNVLAAQKRQRKTHTLDSARAIGIVFDASAANTRTELQEFAKELQEKGKKVKILGYYPTKQHIEIPKFDYFTLKETVWSGLPKSEKAKAFVGEKFDLLLSFNPEELPQLEWMAAASPAAMKIGLATSHKNDFDIQLDTPDGKGFRFFTEQLHLFLDKIVLTKS